MPLPLIDRRVVTVESLIKDPMLCFCFLVEVPVPWQISICISSNQVLLLLTAYYYFQRSTSFLHDHFGEVLFEPPILEKALFGLDHYTNNIPIF